MKPYKKDKEIYRKCISLDWIQPYQIINKKDLVFLGKSEKDIVENIKLFIQEKSMQKKNKSIKEILNSIELLFQFDKMSTKYRDVGFIERVPEFIFYNIKAKPSMLYSTLRFMDLYNKSNNQYILNQWKIIIESILKITHKDLQDITLEDFESKCSEALKKIK